MPTEARAGGALQKDHGYVLEVDPFGKRANRGPVPPRCQGRLAHDAVAVDPGTSVIYKTGDSSGPNGPFFRWTPPAGFRGGKGALRALALSDGGDTADPPDDELPAGRWHVGELSEATLPGTTHRSALGRRARPRVARRCASSPPTRR